MDSRRATRATSETFPPREELSTNKFDEQDAGNRLIRKKMLDGGSRLWQYVRRWLRKHRDDGGYGREDPAVASQTAGSYYNGGHGDEHLIRSGVCGYR